MHSSFEVNRDVIKPKFNPKIKINGISSDESASCILDEWKKLNSTLIK